MNEQSTLAPDAVDRLLAMARQAQQRGDIARAGVLLRMLAAQHPADPRVWQALADQAQTDDERARALAQLQAVTRPPASRYETQVLEAQPPADSPPAPAPPGEPAWEPVSLTPAPAPHPASQIRWPFYLISAIAVLILLALGLLRFLGSPGITAQAPAAPTAQPPATAQSEPGAIPTLPAPEEASAIPAGGQAPQPQPTLAPAPPTATPVPPTATPAPTATPRPVMAPGAVQQEGSWLITLLRPEHALLLDGSIGALQPQGRFALALVAVSNAGATPARVPAELFILEDDRGNRYAPLPAASTAYLATFARGLNGDLSMEEEIPPNSGIVSVPVIFDVPADARGLMLRVGGADAGWPLGDTPAP